jgi:acyl dehydratase
MRFFEEIELGERGRIGAHTFTAAEIKRFATAFDPQPFHLDENAAEASHFGRLCASGWHTLAVWMRLNVRAMQRRAAAPADPAAATARLGLSPGFDELKWSRPVYVGDTISFEYEVTAKRASRTRPGWGLVSVRNRGINQAGEEVISFLGHVFAERRQPADEAAPDARESASGD